MHWDNSMNAIQLKGSSKMNLGLKTWFMEWLGYIEDKNNPLKQEERELLKKKIKAIFTCLGKDQIKDIDNFELIEIPHPNVFCFHNKETGQSFDIRMSYIDSKCIARPQYVRNGKEHIAKSIEEAIGRYESDITIA